MVVARSAVSCVTQSVMSWRDFFRMSITSIDVHPTYSHQYHLHRPRTEVLPTMIGWTVDDSVWPLSDFAMNCPSFIHKMLACIAVSSIDS
jgi:hypothetical protein